MIDNNFSFEYKDFRVEVYRSSLELEETDAYAIAKIIGNKEYYLKFFKKYSKRKIKKYSKRKIKKFVTNLINIIEIDTKEVEMICL